ncbi:MAG: hypothetical protein M9896_15905 [Candidatus Promineofilum sp.]|uniref:hypothetical protein n=1 Tax=Promineifilum sp. TaxID=2664178 RepID=UPI002411F96A|nr:hypothetical protein [Promineifilum sp.]
MKQLIALFLVVALLLACGAASILLARGWFTLRTTSTTVPAAPTIQVVPAAPTPTLAALPPVPGGGDTAPNDDPAGAGGFNGVYRGTLSGDNGSTAIGTLTLTQTGNAVSGQLDIGPGLVLDAGSCGAQSVPQLTQTAAGAVDPATPNRLQTTGSIPVSGFTIGVTLTAELAPGGQTLAARADLDLPFICGRDPVISGTFNRE